MHEKSGVVNVKLDEAAVVNPGKTEYNTFILANCRLMPAGGC